MAFPRNGSSCPRSVHARLVVNGEFVGLFALTEQIDGRFTRHNFEDGTGNLFKEVWPLRPDGEPRSNSEFYEGLKTNEDNRNLDMSQMISFAQEIATEDDGREVMRKWMNIEEIISYAVVDRTIRNDDVFYWYCNSDDILGSDCGNHNFYWYSDPSTGKVLNSMDLDNAENILDANPVTPIADK